MGILKRIPVPVWVFAGIVAFLWIFRGQRFTVPRVSFKQWLLFCAWMGIVTAVIAFAPWWIFIPLYAGGMVFGVLFQELVEIGKSTYEARMDGEKQSGDELKASLSDPSMSY